MDSSRPERVQEVQTALREEGERERPVCVCVCVRAYTYTRVCVRAEKL